MYRIGIDMGSVSVNLVVMSESGEIVKSKYVRHMGRPYEMGRDVLEEAVKEYSADFIAATGTGASEFASFIGASFINEIVALTQGFSGFIPMWAV